MSPAANDVTPAAASTISLRRSPTRATASQHTATGSHTVASPSPVSTRGLNPVPCSASAPVYQTMSATITATTITR